jgi:hypothetical protein
MKLSSDKYVELYSSLAEQIMANGALGMSEYLVEIQEPDGSYVECFSEEGQEIFNYYCDLVCSILDNAGIENAAEV